MRNLLLRFWTDDQGQDIAEYAVILVLVVGTVRLVGSKTRITPSPLSPVHFSSAKRNRRNSAFPP